MPNTVPLPPPKQPKCADAAHAPPVDAPKTPGVHTHTCPTCGVKAVWFIPTP